MRNLIFAAIALIISAPASAFNANYNDSTHSLTIQGLEYRGGHYNISLNDIGGFVFAIGSIELASEATGAYFNEQSGELVSEVLYNGESFSLILKNRGDFHFIVQDIRKIITPKEIDGKWEARCAIITLEDLGIFNAGYKEVYIVDDNRMAYEQYMFTNSNCTGDLISKETVHSEIAHEGETITQEGINANKIKITTDEYEFQIFDGFLLSLMSDYHRQSCGFTPGLGDQIFESRCNFDAEASYIGDIQYQIYFIEGDTLYINTSYDAYPNQLPIENIFIEKFSRVQ